MGAALRSLRGGMGTGAVAGLVVSAVVGAVVIAVAGLIVACSAGGRDARTPGPALRPGAVLEGTYRLDFDAAHQLAGGEPKPYAPFSRWFAFRSTCTARGCIATGSRLQDDDPRQLAEPGFSVVLDYVGGQWETTFAEHEPCAGQNAPVLVSWVLTPGDDDELVGTRIESSVAPGCAYNTEIPAAATRIGDVAASITVADPAAQPALGPSPPNALSGRYSSKVTNPATGATETRPVQLTSACVRNTVQCRLLKTAFKNNGTKVVQAFHFAEGRWATDLHQVSKCSDGSTGEANSHWEYLMPSHPKNPIVKVVGTERQVSTGPCANTTEFALSLARTGAA